MMKQLFYFLTLCVVFFSCHDEPEKRQEPPPVSTASRDTIKLHKLRKLFVVGDFDGDGKQDSLFEHHFSNLTKTEMDSAADPFQQEWDTVINWFYRQQETTYLLLNHMQSDTLHVGTTQGLYCLINIGDNNADGKEEIAFVSDYLDFSRVNSCNIYTLCNHKWTLLKKFGIHEDAFNFTTEESPVFTDIKDYLVKQKGKWVYMDYLQDGYERPEDLGKMMRLKTNTCN